MQILTYTTPAITMSARRSGVVERAGDVTAYHDVASFLRGLSYHGDRMVSREGFFASVHITYRGREFSLEDDLIRIYGDAPIARSKDAHEELRAFFVEHFPDLPRSKDEVIPPRAPAVHQ